MIRLIVCDIDNTLVPKHKQPSDDTIRCIKEFKEKGILFGLASGRSTSQLKKLADQWGISCDILIGMNGGEYQDEITGEYSCLPKLSKEVMKEIFEIMEPFKEKVNVSQLVDGVHYCRRLDDLILNSFKYNKDAKLPTVVPDESMFWSHDAYKVGFRTPADVMPDVEEWVKAHKSDNYRTVKTEFTMFEFCHPEADKGKMLIRFCNSHNIPLEDAVGFGDMTNDIELIKDAGIGVCMENGSLDAKAVADIITEESIEDDGWSKFIRKHVLTDEQDIYTLIKK